MRKFLLRAPALNKLFARDFQLLTTFYCDSHYFLFVVWKAKKEKNEKVHSLGRREIVRCRASYRGIQGETLHPRSLARSITSASRIDSESGDSHTISAWLLTSHSLTIIPFLSQPKCFFSLVYTKFFSLLFFWISFFFLRIYHQQHQSWVKVNQEVLTLLEN